MKLIDFYESPTTQVVSVYPEGAILSGSAVIDDFSGEETLYEW